LFRDADGKQKSAGTYDTRDGALARARMAELDASPPGTHPVERRSKITVAAYATKWLDGTTRRAGVVPPLSDHDAFVAVWSGRQRLCSPRRTSDTAHSYSVAYVVTRSPLPG
jgi:hypothetical protein